MVSFQAHPLSPNQKKAAIPSDSDDSFKKRKWDDDQPFLVDQIFEKRSKPEITERSLFDIELHLETPLPLEWQRCLDIQSGQIHFYNTRTHMKTSRDPRRRSPESPSPPAHMSLDLELNLRSCESLIRKSTNISDDHNINSDSKFHSGISSNTFSDMLFQPHKPKTNNSSSKSRLLGFQLDIHEQQEMLATVCINCHMLVMLCKSSPACPNCKHMHPPDQSPPTLFKPRCSSFMC